MNNERDNSMIKYKIVEVDTNQHSIVVRFYTDKITEDLLATDVLDGVIRRCRTDYSIDLPIPAPVGAALSDFILARAPKDWLENQEKIADPTVDTSMTDLASLIGVEVSTTLTPILTPVVPQISVETITLTVPA